MKKTRITAIIASLAICISAGTVPFRADAFQYISDNALHEFDSNETVYVRITFSFDHALRNEVNESAKIKAQELYDEFMEGVDVTNYQEKLEGEHYGVTITFDPEHQPSDHEKALYSYQELFKARILECTRDEMFSELKKKLGDEMLAELGVTPDEDTIYSGWGNVICRMDQEQIEKAKQSEKVGTITVEDDWTGDFTASNGSIGQYVGTPTNTYIETNSLVVTSVDTSTTVVPQISNNEEPSFYCPDCGRTVPISERISGPLRSICRDCYEAGHYIGTTASMRTTNTTTTTVTTSDTGLANQTNSTTVTIPPLNADIVFKDEEIILKVGEEKSFEYTVTGAEYVSFFSISDIRIVNNTFSDGKGVITLKTSRYSWGDDMVCTLRSGEAFVEKLIPVHVAEPTTFYCPDCGRTVPISERISGPLRSICRDCYEAGHYIGTTAPMRTTNTTTTTVTTSDTGLANQTNSTTVTVPPLNADIVFKDEEIMLEVGKEKEFEYTVTGADVVSFFTNGRFKVVNNTYSNGKGVVTLKASSFSYANSLICTLRSGEAFVEKIIPVHIAESTTFICPKCKREMPVSERIDGPYWWICRECYEIQPIGSTSPQDTDITTTSTTTVTIDPRSTTAPKELCESGDANLDGQTTVADAAAILQYIGNRDKYQLTDQGKKNADVDGVKGITPNDALAIMKWDSFENR